jgi:(p)ppGpp synthase/HD superfamily hydrolase
MTLVEKAKIFATAAHAAVAQKRKYTYEDYICHPKSVAKMVQETGASDEAVAAAWLHDVVEDTKVTLDLIRAEFGDVVGNYVYFLTNVKTEGNRAQRKAAEVERLRGAPAEVHTVKLADILDNLPSIKKYDANFYEVYLKEKRAMVDVLIHGDYKLLEQARKIIND